MSETQPEGVTPEDTNTNGATPDVSQDITKLQSALEKERDARKAADRRAKENESFRAKLEELESASKTELERAIDSARKEGAQSAMQQANALLVRAEARALAAAAKFRDPSDAVAFLGDLGSVTVTEQGNVDTKALNAALADLAKSKPYLLIEEKPVRPTGDAGQGPRVSSGPANMNDLIRAQAGIRMTP